MEGTEKDNNHKEEIYNEVEALSPRALSRSEETNDNGTGTSIFNQFCFSPPSQSSTKVHRATELTNQKGAVSKFLQGKGVKKVQKTKTEVPPESNLWKDRL